MRWKRRACLTFGIVFGLGLTALVGHYGYISSDDHKTGIIVAFIYAGLAAGALFGEGLCVLVWQRHRGWATFGAAVLAAAAITNISNSLDAVVGRSAKTYATQSAAKQTRASNERERGELEKQRREMRFTTTSDDAVKVDTDAVARAEEAARTACELQPKSTRCSERRVEEQKARDAQRETIKQRDLTKAAGRIDARITELSAALAKPDGIQDADAAQQGGSVAIARLFNLPTTKADLIASWKMLLLSAILDLLVMSSFIFYEVLGLPTREERKKLAGVPQPVNEAKEPIIVTEPPIIDITPKPEPLPAPELTPTLPDRPRPKLAATTRQPIGAVLDFLHDGIELVAGARTEMTDAFIGYVAWCKARSLRPMRVLDFVDAITKACRQFGIRITDEGDLQYLTDVQIASVAAKQGTEQS
jgi:hypothetical protein